MKRRGYQEVAEMLAQGYDMKFGGKLRGRYKITRRLFKKLLGRQVLKEAVVYDISEELFDLGYVLMDLGDDFAVLELSVVENYRGIRGE